MKEEVCTKTPFSFPVLQLLPSQDLYKCLCNHSFSYLPAHNPLEAHIRHFISLTSPEKQLSKAQIPKQDM